MIKKLIFGLKSGATIETFWPEDGSTNQQVTSTILNHLREAYGSSLQNPMAQYYYKYGKESFMFSPRDFEYLRVIDGE